MTELFIVDKTLRPKFVEGPVKLAFLPTFFGLIGGVKTMGFLGLFIGPVLMALLVAIWREWLRGIGADERDEPLTADNTALTLNDTNSNIKELSAGYQRKSD